jgi:hypothetical protein
MDIDELAACIIVGLIAGTFWKRKEKRKRIEGKAVVNEYNAEKTTPERQRLLVMHYPQHLMAAPDYRYFQRGSRR